MNHPPKHHIRNILMLSCLVCLPMAQGAEPERFESFDEALRLFNSVPGGGDITAGREERAGHAYGRKKDSPSHFRRDYTDKTANDFSVRFDSPGTDDAGLIGFTPGPWIEVWKVAADDVLRLDLKASAGGPVTLVLLDREKRRASMDLSAFKADGTWQEVDLTLKDFQPEEGFDFAAGIVGCEVRAKLPKGEKIWFDDIHFQQPGGVLGVTEKPIAQRIAETRQTKPARLHQEWETKMSHLQRQVQRRGLSKAYVSGLVKLKNGEDLEEANRLLKQYFESDDAREDCGRGFVFDRYHFHDLALDYGRQGRLAAGRLHPETEKAMLEVIWEAARVSDDIANARQSTWWLIGSENHDIHYKVKCLFTAQVLANHPDFANRIYEDAGTGNGYRDHDPEWKGEGDWADGNEYTPVDHYNAWLKYFREFLRERAKKGLFVEVRSSHYISAQIGLVAKLHTHCGDGEVRELAGMLSDVIWADFVQDSPSGINGGAKTRSSVRTRMMDTLRPLLGGPGANDLTYELPPVIWKLALKREGLGDFAYLSRRPGEEEDRWPRPKGAERSQLCGAESRFLRYSWVTPDYVLGTQMDHPAAVHSHPSIVSRWNGVIFSSSLGTPNQNNAGVYPYLQPKPEYGGQNKYIGGQHYKDFMYVSMQDRNVLITQQPKPMRVRHVSPRWFPTDHAPWTGKDICVYMEDADEIIERKGWVFVRKGNAYVAVRPVMIDPADTTGGRFPRLLEDSYTWSENKKAINLKDPYSPIIMDTGRQATHGTFVQYQDTVLANPLKLRVLIAGSFDVIYRGSDPEAKEIVFNTDSNDLPTVGGIPVNHSHPKVFDSPYLSSDYNSGVVTVRRGDETLTLDFNKIERREDTIRNKAK